MSTNSVSSLLSVAFGSSSSPALSPTQVGESVQAIRAVNQAGLFGADRELTFSVDPLTRTLIIRLVNSETHDVIRQIPSEELMRLREILK